MENKRIIVLDDNTINQIAAGEVIEKPASIVKELVENSIDASASKISISIKMGGLEEIRVRDNGNGLLGSEFNNVFKRYATSKLETIEDLYTLNTMGFRGEALASIAAVSKVKFSSKTSEEEIGASIVIEGGVKVDEIKEAMQKGTNVTVRDIFYNTPVRKKFLNGTFKETRDIVDIVEKLMLSRLDIRFELFVDDRLLIKSKGNGNLRELASQIFSLEVAKDMLEISGEKNGIRINALIGGVNQYRGNRSQIVFFINNRFVISGNLTKCFVEAYKNSLPINRFPIGIIYINIPSYLIEVNIHPRKMEVRIDEEKELGEFLKSLVLKNLYEVKDTFFKGEEKSLEKVFKEEIVSYISDDKNNVSIKNGNNVSKDKEEFSLFKEEVYNPFSNIRIYGAFKDTYILASLEDELLIIDQHAAHERVNFEKAEEEFRENGFKTQTLIEGIIVNLGNSDYLKVINHIGEITDYGVILEEFGINTFIIRGLPLGIPGVEVNREFLMSLVDKIDSGDKNIIERYMIEKASCIRSIKAGYVINNDDLKALMIELGKCKYPFTCPHGRPIFLKYTLKDLEKLFLRS